MATEKVSMNRPRGKPLDGESPNRHSGVPNRKRRICRLCAAPQREKNGYLYCHCELAEQRPVSVRTGGLLRAGERCFAFFVFQPLNREVYHG